jgi:ELWxxDGT repeat protein
MNRTLSAILLGLLMVMMPLAGCVSDGTDGLQGPEGPEGPPGADGSSLHLVVAESDLPECNGDLQGQIYFVSSDGAFQVCSTMGWSVVDLTGTAGTDGTNGTDGQDGSPGANGADGTNGTDGQDGLNGTDGTDGQDGTDGLAALAVTTTLSAGSSNSNCPDGGVQIDVGIDDNGNGVLDSSEIDQTTYICNGADGADGGDGADGSASPNTILTSISSPSASLECDAGGRVIAQGLDNGDGGGVAQNGVLESGEVDYTTTYCSKYIFEIDDEIASGSDSSYPGYYMDPILVGDTIYFDALTVLAGWEMWAHDASNASTWQVADLYSGSDSSSPGLYGMEILVGDTIYFSANDGVDGREMWAHDTSNHSTWQVADINSGSLGSNPGQYMDSILVGDTIYFDANDGVDGVELWAHDTSNQSTWQVADINSGSDSSRPGFYMDSILIGDTIYFDAFTDVDGRELWAHDTSNHSTWQVADIWSGSDSSYPGYFMGSILVVGDTIYFDANDGVDGTELWAHDTSNQSTWQVADINSGVGGSIPYGNDMEFLVGDTIYFSADDAIDGIELWAHDTSNASTWQVADINSGSVGSYPGQYGMEILVGDTIYFGADDGNDGIELWAHDTSNASTWQVADLYSGSDSSRPGQYMDSILVGDTIYFDADDGNDGIELWAMKIEHSIYY